MVAWGGAQIAIFLACVAGAKRGGEGGESAKKGRMKGSLPSLPNPSLFFPSSLSPTPFDAWLLFSRRVKQEPKKRCLLPAAAGCWMGNTGRGLLRLAKCFQKSV